MENKTNIFETLLERAEDLTKTNIELLKLNTLDKTSNVISTGVSRIIDVVFFYIAIIMGSIGVSLWLGEILGKTFYGFFIVSAFYCISGFILFLFFHKIIKKIVGDFIIKEILK